MRRQHRNASLGRMLPGEWPVVALDTTITLAQIVALGFLAIPPFAAHANGLAS